MVGQPVTEATSVGRMGRLAGQPWQGEGTYGPPLEHGECLYLPRVGRMGRPKTHLLCRWRDEWATSKHSQIDDTVEYLSRVGHMGCPKTHLRPAC